MPENRVPSPHPGWRGLVPRLPRIPHFPRLPRLWRRPRGLRKYALAPGSVWRPPRPGLRRRWGRLQRSLALS